MQILKYTHSIIILVRQPKVLYMINPDPIFYAEMDDLIINQL